MKFLILAALIFCLTSCKPSVKSKGIFGSWRTIINPKYSNNGLSDSLVFVAPNSLKIYNLSNGTIADSIFGTFEFNAQTNQLLTRYDTTKFRFEVIELNDNSLVIQQVGTTLIQKFKRLR